MSMKFEIGGEKGFTLVELVIVVAIIGILSSIAIAQFHVFQTRSFNRVAQADLRNFANAQEAYFVDNEEYSDDETLLVGSPYGVYTSDLVTVDIISTSSTGYVMTSKHASSPDTFRLEGPGGSIEKQ
jgi:prepilin-type N-terminal cleavage/methylation domain-containing protein